MPNSTDYGSQAITFDYKNTAASTSFNKLLKDLVQTGIYRMDGEVSTTNNHPVIPPMVVFIQSNNANSADQVGVRVETTNTEELTTCSDATPYVVLRLEWSLVENNFMEMACVDAPNIKDQDLVVTKVLFDGSGNITGYDNTVRDWVSKEADTIEMGEGVSSTPQTNPSASGAASAQSSTINGSSDIVDSFREVFDRLRDLSGVNTNAVNNRLLDYGTQSDNVKSQNLPIGSDLTGGGIIGTISSTTDVYTALQSILSGLKNANGIDDGVLARQKLNLTLNGSGLNGAFVQIGLNIARTLAAHSNVNISESDMISAALEKLADSVQNIEATVDSNSSAISSNQTQISDVKDSNDNLEALPVGTILMYDGTGWQDNTTLPGWYACTASNASAQGIDVPNLEDRFVKGGNSSSAGSSGGNSSFTLSESNLPPHTHNMDHGHSASSSTDGNHFHSHNISNSKNQEADTNFSGSGQDLNQGITSDTTSSTGSHDHTITVENYDSNAHGNTGNGGFANSPVSFEPSFYQLIYIKKVSQP